ncbi:hypothetical protein [Shewanella surugensis]|nr:hypothetical protein [Shewanella surugensis]
MKKRVALFGLLSMLISIPAFAGDETTYSYCRITQYASNAI